MLGTPHFAEQERISSQLRVSSCFAAYENEQNFKQMHIAYFFQIDKRRGLINMNARRISIDIHTLSIHWL